MQWHGAYRVIENKQETQKPTLWYDVHGPSAADELVGNSAARQTVRDWFAASNDPSKLSLVISGPCGVGKTKTVQLEAERAGQRLIELNLHEVNSTQVTGCIRKAVCEGAVLFINDVDSMAAHFALAYRTLLKLRASNRTVRTVCTTQPGAVMSLQKLAQCVTVEFQPLTESEVTLILQQCLAKAGKRSSAELLARVVESAHGDARAAVVQLEFEYVIEGHKQQQQQQQPSAQREMQVHFKQAARLSHNKQPLDAAAAVEGVRYARGYLEHVHICRAPTAVLCDALSSADVLLGVSRVCAEVSDVLCDAELNEYVFRPRVAVVTVQGALPGFEIVKRKKLKRAARRVVFKDVNMI